VITLSAEHLPYDCATNSMDPNFTNIIDGPRRPYIPKQIGIRKTVLWSRHTLLLRLYHRLSSLPRRLVITVVTSVITYSLIISIYCIIPVVEYLAPYKVSLSRLISSPTRCAPVPAFRYNPSKSCPIRFCDLGSWTNSLANPSSTTRC